MLSAHNAGGTVCCCVVQCVLQLAGYSVHTIVLSWIAGSFIFCIGLYFRLNAQRPHQRSPMIACCPLGGFGILDRMQRGATGEVKTDQNSPPLCIIVGSPSIKPKR